MLRKNPKTNKCEYVLEQSQNREVNEKNAYQDEVTGAHFRYEDICLKLEKIRQKQLKNQEINEDIIGENAEMEQINGLSNKETELNFQTIRMGDALSNVKNENNSGNKLESENLKIRLSDERLSLNGLKSTNLHQRILSQRSSQCTNIKKLADKARKQQQQSKLLQTGPFFASL